MEENNMNQLRVNIIAFKQVKYKSVIKEALIMFMFILLIQALFVSILENKNTMAFFFGSFMSSFVNEPNKFAKNFFISIYQTKYYFDQV